MLRSKLYSAPCSLGLPWCKGRLAEAEVAYGALLERRPDDAQALFHLGVACRQQGRLDDAFRHCQRALQLAPGVQQQAGKSAPTPADLLTMCEEIALQKGLRHGVEPRAELGVPLMAGLSFHAEGTFIRIWVVFDGRHFVAASYICALGAEALELGEAEVIVRSVVWR